MTDHLKFPEKVKHTKNKNITNREKKTLKKSENKICNTNKKTQKL